MYKLSLYNGCVAILYLILWLAPAKVSAQEQKWLDSLYVRLGDPRMDRTDGKAILKFDLEIYRPVAVWDRDDYTLGASDFILGKEGLDMSKIFSKQDVRSLHAQITPDINKALRISSRFVLGKFHISMTPNRLNPVKVEIPFKEWVKLCEVSMELANPATVEIGLTWVRTSSGLITAGNIPIMENFQDDLERIPDNLLTFIDYSSSQSACPGEDITLFAKAVSSGTALTYQWSRQVAPDTWENFPATIAGQPGNRNDWESIDGYQYQIRGNGDTLVIKGLPVEQSGILIKCRAEDLTVPTSPNYREIPEIQVSLLPEVKVALEAYTPKDLQKILKQPNDTAFHCPGMKASVRAVFYGITSGTIASNFQNQVGEIHVRYKKTTNLGTVKYDTLVVDSKNVAYVAGTEIMTSLKADLNVEEDGKYYIDKVWTNKCSACKVLTQYDTVIVKSRSNAELTFDPISYVAGSGGVDVVTDLGMSFTDVSILPIAKGTLFNNDYSCPKGVVGTDTLVYTFEDAGCTLYATRLVHISSSKTLAVKVFLEGPYSKEADSMYCLYTPDLEDKNISPYPDEKRCSKPFPAFGKRIADWIYIELWDYPPYGLTSADPKRGRKIDSTSAFLLSDGTVASVDGNKYLSFGSLVDDSYYVVVKHRNHMPVMSAKKITLAAGKAPEAINTIDFTASMENAFDKAGAVTMQYPLKDGAKDGTRLLMYAGEIIDDGQILSSDMKYIIMETGNSKNKYNSADLDFDGTVLPLDKLKCNINMSILRKY